MHILWIVNKYVDGTSPSRYFPYFLKQVEKEVEKTGNKISFAYFSNAMRPRVKSVNNFFYESPKAAINNAQQIAEELEHEYQFTFKQAYFPDQIQVSKRQDYRQLNLSEKEFNNLEFLIPKFLFLEKIINQEKIDVVFCDQSPEVEMEFGRAICYRKNKIFLRQTDSFLGRCTFQQQFEFDNERVALPAINPEFTFASAKDYVNDFIQNKRPPYINPPFLPVDIKEYYLPRLLHFYRYPQFIKLALEQPYLYFEEKVLKPLIIDKFDPSRPYLLFGLHLPTEATVTLRSLPYMTQSSLIESISRVLPYGHYLYVREHPCWRKHFPYSFLKRISQLPCVKIISPNIPISGVLKHSRGILTYNSTTGIEALMYGKPVLSFAPNVYRDIHPAVSYCDDLYGLGSKLVKLVNTTVNQQDTYQYIYQLFRSSSGISLQAGTFLSEEDSDKKAPVFCHELLLSIKYCQEK